MHPSTCGRRWRLPACSSRAIPPSSAPADGSILFFVPARDEAPRLAAVLARVPSTVCDRAVVTAVIDDGSGDTTSDVAREAGARVVRHEIGRGLGAAVRTGFDLAVETGAIAVAFCDGDGEYDPSELERLVSPIVEGRADYVVGSRFAGNVRSMRRHRRLGNRILTRWVRWMCRLPITDGQSGFRALSARAAATVRVAHDYNYAQVLTLDLVGHGWRYTEVPITYRFRTSGRSFVRLGDYLSHVVPTVVHQLSVLHRTASPSHQETPREPIPLSVLDHRRTADARSV